VGPFVFVMFHRDSLQGRRGRCWKVEDLDNNLTAMTHEKSNDNGNAHTRSCGG
jgi:hypothetical protein